MCAESCYNVGVFSVVVVVGFVQPNYTFSEDAFWWDAHVCVRVFNPPQDEDLLFNIDLIIQPRIATAGKFAV